MSMELPRSFVMLEAVTAFQQFVGQLWFLPLKPSRLSRTRQRLLSLGTQPVRCETSVRPKGLGGSKIRPKNR